MESILGEKLELECSFKRVAVQCGWLVFNFSSLAEINPIIGIGFYWCLSDIFRRSVTRAKEACIINKNIVYPTNYLLVNTDTSEIYHVR